MNNWAVPAFDDVSVGDVVAQLSYEVTRQDLVRYAGAGGDINPIHFNDAFAHSVGLDGVIAHGMHTMGRAMAVAEQWLGDQRAVVDIQTRFARPIPVPALASAVVEVTVTVGARDEELRRVRLDITVISGGVKVLAKAQMVAQLA